MLQKSTFRMSELAGEIERLSLEHLEFVALLQAIHQLVQSRKPDHVFVTWGMATEILRFFLGDKWTNENVFGCHPDVSPEHKEGRAFMRAESFVDAGDQEGRFRNMERVTSLAECLYNLQDIPEIKHRVALMQGGGLEAALGELECAKKICAPAFKLRFIAPTGKKGADYDCEFSTLGGRVLCGEIKTKVESTEYGTATIYNTFESARKQLPKGRPGVIFLKIPEGWTNQADSKAAFDAAITKVLRQSDRLVTVVIAWEEWRQLGEGRIVLNRYMPFHNTRSSQYAADIEQAFEAAGALQNSEWVSFMTYVSSRLPTLVAFAERRHALNEDAGPDQPHE
jgi:hypothetical protein